MTSIYNNFKELLFNGGIDLDTDTIEVALVSDSPAYTPDIDGEAFVDDVLDGGVTASELSGTGYSRKTVTITVAQDNTNDRVERHEMTEITATVQPAPYTEDSR